MVSTIHDTRLVARRPQGSHLCQFYRSESEVLELVTAFFADGVVNGERGIWALPDWLPREKASAELRRRGPRMEHALDDSSLILRTPQEIYEERGAFRGVEGVLKYWMDEERAALERGFVGLRVSGDGTWKLTPEEEREFLRYEGTINGAIEQTKIAALCTYDARILTEERIKGVLATHRQALVRRPGGWEELTGETPASRV